MQHCSFLANNRSQRHDLISSEFLRHLITILNSFNVCKLEDCKILVCSMPSFHMRAKFEGVYDRIRDQRPCVIIELVVLLWHHDFIQLKWIRFCDPWVNLCIFRLRLNGLGATIPALVATFAVRFGLELHAEATIVSVCCLSFTSEAFQAFFGEVLLHTLILDLQVKILLLIESIVSIIRFARVIVT